MTIVLAPEEARRRQTARPTPVPPPATIAMQSWICKTTSDYRHPFRRPGEYAAVLALGQMGRNAARRRCALKNNGASVGYTKSRLGELGDRRLRGNLRFPNRALPECIDDQSADRGHQP